MTEYKILKQTDSFFYCKKCANTIFKNLKLISDNKFIKNPVMMVTCDCLKCNFNNMIYQNKVKKIINLKEKKVI